MIASLPKKKMTVNGMEWCMSGEMRQLGGDRVDRSVALPVAVGSPPWITHRAQSSKKTVVGELEGSG